MSDSPSPAAPQTSTKAWVAGLGTLILPLMFQNLIGLNDAASTIWNWIACGTFGTICPEPQLIADAFKSAVGAVLTAVVTGVATYWIPNRSSS